jgi:hypothetical protein
MKHPKNWRQVTVVSWHRPEGQQLERRETRWINLDHVMDMQWVDTVRRTELTFSSLAKFTAPSPVDESGATINVEPYKMLIQETPEELFTVEPDPE